MNNNPNLPILVLLMLWLLVFSVSAQSNYWPIEFSLPANTTGSSLKAPDSTKHDSSVTLDSAKLHLTKKSPVTLNNEVSVNELFKSKNELLFCRDEDKFLFEQRYLYMLSNYYNGIMDHYVELSGKYLRKGLLFSAYDALGFDWVSGIKFYKSKVQFPIDIGPVTKFHISSIPVQIRGGVSAYGWNDSINQFSDLYRTQYHGKPGYYGNISVGDSLQRWFHVPLIANINAIGKSISGNGIGTVASSVRTAFDYGTGDSIYFLLGDSLTNGKALDEDGMSRSLYSDIPWKIEHNLTITGAVKGKGRFFLRPAAIYSYTLNTIRYPSQPDLNENVKTNKNNVILQLSSASDSKVVYKGGISFLWENADWLYNESLTSINADRKKQETNVEDCKEYVAVSDNDLTLNLPHSCAINYQLHAFKDSRHYPYTYNSGDTVFANEFEDDRVRLNHHVGLLYDDSNKVNCELYGEYEKSYLYYYRKEHSGESQIGGDYKIGFNTGVTIGNINLNENAFAEAENTEYKFKDVHTGSNNVLPPYTRRVSSLFIVSWNINQNWTLTGKWNEMYYDKGRWYDKAYSDSTFPIKKNFYFIESKTTDYSFQILGGYTSKNIGIQGGVRYKDSYQRDKNTHSMLDSTIIAYGTKYLVEPSIEFSYISPKVVISTKIIRKINANDDNRWKFSKNWDISLVAKSDF